MNRDDLNQTGIDQTALYIVIVLASVFYDDIQIQLFQSMIFFQVWTNLLEVKRDNTLILFFKMTTAYLYDVSSLSRLFRSKQIIGTVQSCMLSLPILAGLITNRLVVDVLDNIIFITLVIFIFCPELQSSNYQYISFFYILPEY